MNTNPRRRSPSPQKVQTTADATPTLGSMVKSMSAGPVLDEQVGQAFAHLGQPMNTIGISTTWSGAQQLIERLTALGYFLELQTHAHSCLCRVLLVLRGKAVSKQLATTEAPTLPEAVAKATLLTLLEMEPPPV